MFTSNRAGAGGLYLKTYGSTAPEQLIFPATNFARATDWSRDGRTLLFQHLNSNTKWDLWILPLDGERKAQEFLKTSFLESGGVFSPDARWIAYFSDESGKYEVYVQSYPASGRRWSISNNGGEWPRWGPKGDELFYLAPGDLLMRVAVKTSPEFEASVPKPLFHARRRAPNPFSSEYAVSSTGQKFLLNRLVEESSAAPLTVVLNWAAELKKK